MFETVKKMFLSKSDLPSAAFIHEANNECQYTPDIAYLERYEMQLIFVADDLKSPFPAHELIKRGMAVGLGRCFTRDQFLMWKKPLGLESFPIPIPAREDNVSPVNWWPKPAKIKGELYAIYPFAFKQLDAYRRNGVQFVRNRIRLSYAYREVKKLHLPKSLEAVSKTELNMYYKDNPKVGISDILFHHPSAWMYSGREAYWDHQFGDTAYDSQLQPMKTYLPNNGGFVSEYYEFTRNELQR